MFWKKFLAFLIGCFAGVLCMVIVIGVDLVKEEKLNQSNKTYFSLYDGIQKNRLAIKELKDSYSHLTISKELVVSAYNPLKEQTDLTPNITASMELIKPGMVAVSRDLFYGGWSFGKKIYIEGHGVFEIQDLMNERYKNSIDILMYHKGDAKRFGRKILRTVLIGRVK